MRMDYIYIKQYTILEFNYLINKYIHNANRMPYPGKQIG